MNDNIQELNNTEDISIINFVKYRVKPIGIKTTTPVIK